MPITKGWKSKRTTLSTLKDFGNRIMTDLKKAIHQQFHDRVAFLYVIRGIEAIDPLEAELDFHESFVENRTRLFIGRKELIKKLQDYVESDSKNILALYGEPGMEIDSTVMLVLLSVCLRIKRTQTGAGRAGR